MNDDKLRWVVIDDFSDWGDLNKIYIIFFC